MKNVLLVVDSHKWCFGHMARGIARYSSDEYAVMVLDGTEFHEMQKANPRTWHNVVDAICQFSWTEATYRLPIRNSVVVAHEGCLFPYPYNEGYLTSVSTPLRNRYQAENKLPLADHILFFNQFLRDKFSALHGTVVPLAIDSGVFKPHDIGSRNVDRGSDVKFIVGWCAQRDVVHKGEALLAEVIRQTSLLYPNEFIFECVDTRASDGDVVSQQGMADWYRWIDAFVCTAASEGGPMPLIEAAACGTPTISTPVGIAESACEFIVDQCLCQEDVPHVARQIVDFLYALKTATRSEYTHDCVTVMGMQKTWSECADVWLQAICGEAEWT